MNRWPVWRRRVAWAVLSTLVVAGALSVARRPLLTAIGRQLIVDDRLDPADAIVVLSGGVPGREIEAADLFREGVAPRIVLPHDPEPAAYAVLASRGVTVETQLALRLRVLTALGVPRERIVILEPEIQSTDAEAEAVRRWIASDPAHPTRLVIVTSSLHTGRARFTFRRALAGAGVGVTVRGSRVGRVGADQWWRSRVGLRDGLIEWQKYVWYRLRY